MKIRFIILFFLSILISCDEETTDLPSADSRVEEAVEGLRAQLMSSSTGWVLNYRPIPDAGTYYMLLEFGEDEVRIQSDLPQDDGDYHDRTIPYRIDAQLDLELIFETYASFHYLFEQGRSNFGAEFEFFYVDQIGNDLVFASKTDPPNELTIITLSPAPADAENGFSREMVENMQEFELPSPIIFGGQILQQLYLVDEDISIFWDISFLRRSIILDAAAEGNSIDEIVAANNFSEINHETGYTFIDGKIVLEEPFSYDVAGSSGTISEVSFLDFSMTGAVYCESGGNSGALYTGNISDIGSVELRQTMFQSGGLLFDEREQSYGVNVLFVADGEGRALIDGVVGEHYPDAFGFIVNFGAVSTLDPPAPSYGIGIAFADDNGDAQLHMREFDPVSIESGNQLLFNLNDDFFYTTGGSVIDEQNMREITDEIFSDSQFYISLVDTGDEDLVLFRLFNACTSYEFFLVQPDS